MTDQEQRYISSTIARLQAELDALLPFANYLDRIAHEWNPSFMDIERAREATRRVKALKNTIATFQRQL